MESTSLDTRTGKQSEKERAGWRRRGSVVVTTGGVRDPKMSEEFPEGWGFGRAALKAADKLKYNPRVVDGVGQEVPGVLYKFSFQMAK